MRLIISAALLMFLTSCASPPPSADEVMESIAETSVYECGEFEFVTRNNDDGILLYMTDDTLIMQQVISASGAKYQGSGGTLWVKGEEATLDLGYRSYRDCKINHHRGPWEDARRRGVQFRAVGQEPGWFLEIKPGQNILLVGDYGGSRYLFNAPEPALEEGVAIYRTENSQNELVVEINADWCQDSMSGQVFSNRVVLNLDGKEFRGCGEAFEDEWR
jgi:membrane-bound inhibitor of C-type lysozyme/uncharacterized membrane protein